MHVIFNCEITFLARVTNGIPVDPSVDAAVVGLTGWIIFEASTVKLPSLSLFITIHGVSQFSKPFISANQLNKLKTHALSKFVVVVRFFVYIINK